MAVQVLPVRYTGNDSIYFHLRDNIIDVISLTATTDLNYDAPMQVTTQPMQSGQTITDNYQRAPRTVSLTGVVVVGYSGIFLRSLQTRTVENFITTCQLWRDQKQVLSVVCPDGLGLSDCVITEFKASKDVGIKNGIRVNLTFQEINFRPIVGRTTVTTEQKSSGGNATTKDGATTSKTVKGSVATDIGTGKIGCQGLIDARQAGVISFDASMTKAVADCEWSQKTTKGVKAFSPSASKQAEDLMKKHGLNPNKRVP